MAMTLYGCPRSRSLRAAWALEEAGAEYGYEFVDLMAGKGRQPPYLALNPGGKVPLLMDGDLTLTESGAICIHLGDRYPDSGLVPASGTPGRATCYRWCFFVVGELEQPLWTMAKHSFALPEKVRVPEVKATAAWEWSKAAKVLAEGLGDREYIAGDGFTAADIMVAHSLAWARAVEVPLEHDNLEAYADRMLARPACGRAVAREKAASEAGR
jgi:glutathione S-transferase